jgi:mitochondrial import inner membrane translocase subunit TIM16
MNQFKEQMGSMITTPMTREEALQILNIEKAAEVDESAEPVENPNQEAEHVMERFEHLFEKNMPERGGSFYIQSKVYFAKEFLMQDFPIDLNQSKYNPGAAP